MRTHLEQLCVHLGSGTAVDDGQCVLEAMSPEAITQVHFAGIRIGAGYPRPDGPEWGALDPSCPATRCIALRHEAGNAVVGEGTVAMTKELHPARIVAGVDGSDSSIEALRAAQHLALAMSAGLEAAGCWEYPNMRSARITLGAVGGKAGAQLELDEAVDAALGRPRPENLTVSLIAGPAESRLVEAGRTAQLLVVGRRGHGGLNGLLVGSVSSACVRHAQCPVLVVHEPAGQPSTTTFESWNQAMARELNTARIVVGVDGSPSSVRALREGERLATALGSRVDAVACWDYPSIWAAPYPLVGGDFQGEADAALKFSLEAAFGQVLPTNVSGRLLQAQVRNGLMEASHDALMLVVGRSGRGGFGGLSLGSVSSACISHAQCPVLVVHTGPEEKGIDFKEAAGQAQKH